MHTEAVNLAGPLTAAGAASAPRFQVSLRAIRRAVLWLLIACGCVGAIQPSPYEFMFLAAALAFARDGLLFDRAMIPLIVLLAMYNAGGLLALAPWVGDSDSVTFVATSIYIGITAVFFAALIAKDPLAHMRTIRSGYVAAGCVAASFGIAGYFDVAGLGEYLTLYGRAAGTFKDPNVFGPFLVPPMVWLTQDVLLKRGAGLWRAALPFLVMFLGLLLSFSRGAWGVWAASTFLMVALTFLTTTSASARQRIASVSALGLVAIATLLVIALSIPEIRNVFEIRASLNQDYDLGEVGRFGAQVRSIPLLLEAPFGFGPLQFRNLFHNADPHEVYLNAFASYGWLGGLSYLSLAGVTLYYCLRLPFLRTPFQSEAIAACCCLAVQLLQGVQIDTDHWRHLFLLFGIVYGLGAASRRYPAGPRRVRGALAD